MLIRLEIHDIRLRPVCHKDGILAKMSVNEKEGGAMSP